MPSPFHGGLRGTSTVPCSVERECPPAEDAETLFYALPAEQVAADRSAQGWIRGPGRYDV
jgi:hypothetical protein